MDVAESVEAFGYKQELRRSLSMIDLLVYGLVFISPIAPFAVFGFVYNASQGMVPLIYFVGLVAMLFTAMSYVTMARAFPIAGSVYAYAGRSIGPAAGFIAGWGLLLDYLLCPAFLYLTCGVALGAMVPAVPQWVWTVGLLIANTTVNYFGIESTARISFLLLGLQIIVLVIFMGAAMFGLVEGVAGAHLSLAPLYDPAKVSPGLIFGGLSLAVLSFLGFDAISTLAEEARGGGKTVAKATLLSLILTAGFFVAQSYLISLFVLDRPAFAPGDETEQATYIIADMLGGTPLKFIVSMGGTLLVGIPGALAAQAATSRLLYGMARDGKLPRFLAYVSPTRKVPDWTLLLVAMVTIILLVVFDGRIELLATIVNFGALTGFVLLHLSVIAQFMWRQKSPHWGRHLLAPLIGLVVILYVLWNMDPMAQIVGLCWLALGSAVLIRLRFTKPIAG